VISNFNKSPASFHCYLKFYQLPYYSFLPENPLHRNKAKDKSRK